MMSVFCAPAKMTTVWFAPTKVAPQDPMASVANAPPRAASALGLPGIFLIWVSAGLAIAMVAAAVTVTNMVVSPTAQCLPSYYKLQTTASSTQGETWNLRWKKWLYPPGQDYSTAGTCSNSETWDVLPLTCPSGCNPPAVCAPDYEDSAERFNKCMLQVHRHMECAKHVDCDGEMFSHYTFTSTNEPDPFAYQARSVGTKLERCPFIDRQVFLADCEARTSYADQRESSGVALGLTFGIPAAILVLVVLRMVVHTPRQLRSAWERARTSDGVELSARAVDAAQARLAKIEQAVGKAGTLADAAAGSTMAQAELAKSAAGSAKKVVQSIVGKSAKMLGFHSKNPKAASERKSSTPDRQEGGQEGGCGWSLLSNPWMLLAMAVGNEALELVSQVMASDER